MIPTHHQFYWQLMTRQNPWQPSGELSVPKSEIPASSGQPDALCCNVDSGSPGCMAIVAPALPSDPETRQ